APSRIEIAHRPYGPPWRRRRRKGRRGFCRSGRDAGRRQIPERRAQALRCAELFERALSLSQHPQIHPPDVRGVRPATLLLGDRHHPDAVLLPAMRNDVHRRAAVAAGPRQGAGHGAGGLRLARLEAAGLITEPHYGAGSPSGLAPALSPLGTSAAAYAFGSFCHSRMPPVRPSVLGTIVTSGGSSNV